MFITFEGIEGCGKTTLMRNLAAALETSGIKVAQTREPGGSALGCQLREILLSPGKFEIAPLSELFLFLADRAQHLEEVIKPALSGGKWVLCDRFHDSTIAYQQYGRGLEHLPLPVLKPMPDITFLIDLDVKTGLQRAANRNHETASASEAKFDNEKIDFHERVRHGFTELSKRYPARIKLLNGLKSPDQLCQDCLSILGGFCKNGTRGKQKSDRI